MRPDCYDYIRRTYGVPARVGGRVSVGGRPGTLRSMRGDQHYLHVRFDDATFTVNAHPIDRVEYLDSEPQAETNRSGSISADLDQQ